jgi:hypothetical protein
MSGAERAHFRGGKVHFGDPQDLHAAIIGYRPQLSNRAGLGPVERIVYGELLDQAERGASSWIVVVHAAVLTIVILILLEVLRWLVRRLRASRSMTEPGAGVPGTDSGSA